MSSATVAISVRVDAASALNALRKGEKRFAYAVSNAINNTALEVQRAMRDRVSRVFTLRRKGFLLSFFPAEKFTLESGADALREYKFNTHKIRHLFCSKCGTQAFAYGHNPDGSEVRAVNLRCVPEVDLAALTLHPYDGASA